MRVDATRSEAERLLRFAAALHPAADGRPAADVLPVGKPLATGPLPAALADGETAQFLPAFAASIACLWRDERLSGAPPKDLTAGPAAGWILLGLHDLVSLSLRADAPVFARVGEFLRSLPPAARAGEILAAHGFLRHARPWHAGWPEAIRSAYAALVERSAMTRFAQADLHVSRDWSGTDGLMAIGGTRPFLRRALLPSGHDATRRWQSAGAVLSVLGEGRGTSPQPAFVLDVYDAFFYHGREPASAGGGRERFQWDALIRIERLLRSRDSRENEDGARRFAYFDPLLEITAQYPSALERFPNLTQDVLEALAVLARWVPRGASERLAFRRP